MRGYILPAQGVFGLQNWKATMQQATVGTHKSVFQNAIQNSFGGEVGL